MACIKWCNEKQLQVFDQFPFVGKCPFVKTKSQIYILKDCKKGLKVTLLKLVTTPTLIIDHAHCIVNHVVCSKKG